MRAHGFARHAAGVFAFLMCVAPAGASALDCYEPGSALERAACAIDSLRDQLLGIDLAYARVAGELPAAEADALRAQQSAWGREIVAMCDLGSITTGQDLPDWQSSCVGNHVQDWRDWLQGYHRRIGPFDVVARSIAAWNRDRYYEVRVQYPELLRPAGKGEQAFNDWSLATAARDADGFETSEFVRAAPVSDRDRQTHLPSTLRRAYRLELAAPSLIAIVWDDYVYGTGAAHGIPSTEGTLFSLAAGRPLAAADVFAGDADWPQQATELCLPQLAAQIPETETGFTPTAVRKIVEEFRSWSFGARGATITFDVYTIASYASGVNECRLSYDVLRPLLNPTLSFGHG